MIDFHIHITPPDISAGWRKYTKNEPYFSLLSSSSVNKFACAEDVIAMLPESSDRAVVFGFGFRDMGLCRYVNDYVIAKTREHHDKLIGFMAVSPAGAGVEREIARCHGAGLKGVGEIFPCGQGFSLEDAGETAAFTGACSVLGLPVLLHANEPVGHLYSGKTDIPLKQIDKFIDNDRALKIVLAHFGGGLFIYEAMPEIREKFRNVYYDTAAAPFLYDERIYRAIKALSITEKILFGSDFPLLTPARYLDALDKSGMTTEEKQLIMGGNAEKLFAPAGGAVTAEHKP